MRTFAIDPGTTESAYVLINGGEIVSKGKEANRLMRSRIASTPFDVIVIEQMACYGMAVGASVFWTCYETGRFIQIASEKGKPVYMIPRQKVKLHICNSSRAKDANVRTAIIDMYEATGGGKTPQIGTKKEPGPLYGMANDMWAALGVAITFLEAPTFCELIERGI